ncbi:MAG: cobalamin-independent methionine synthase II family protein [Dehalococcoidia bacterium]
MKRSTGGILTSHVGSLPRPLDLYELLVQRSSGDLRDEAGFDARVKEAVADVVRRQADIGIDVVSDGEQSKPMFSDYIADRVSGFEGSHNSPDPFVNHTRHPEPFPEYAAWRDSGGVNLNPGAMTRRPKCVGPLAWKDRAYEEDIVNFKEALAGVSVAEGFMPSPSPGIIAMRLPNEHYASEEEYLFAIADVMRDEYQAIVDAGLMLQIDAPDTAMAWDRQHWESLEEFRAAVAMRIDALNHALRDIPEEQVRFHVCWGNTENPHTGDVPLADIVDLVLRVKASAYAVEAANPRHAHEWAVWEDVKLPDGKALMPGVIDSVTNFVEHPDLVAQRIVRYANLVGRENVIAGVDCGFGTRASATPRVHPELVMAKFASLAEGARRASKQLWG